MPQNRIASRDPHEKEFLQAFEEVVLSLKPLFDKKPFYLDIMETLAEPEKVHYFRVPWIDDQGRQRVSRQGGTRKKESKGNKEEGQGGRTRRKDKEEGQGGGGGGGRREEVWTC